MEEPALYPAYQKQRFYWAFLPEEERDEAMKNNHYHLAVMGVVDLERGVVIIWNGQLHKFTTLLRCFKTSGDGTKPDFTRFSIVDWGHTLAFGDYESSTLAVMDGAS